MTKSGGSRRSPHPAMAAGAWRFAAVPLAAIAAGAWLTWPADVRLGECMAGWQLDRMTKETPLDVVAVGGARIALICLHDGRTYSFMGVLLADPPPGDTIPSGRLPAARAARVAPGAYTDDEAAALIDDAIAIRYGCRPAAGATGALAPSAARLPRLARLGLARRELACGGRRG